MKRFALTLVAAAAALFVGTDAASAQNFSWGPKVGFNVSSMSHSDMNAKVGFTAGVFGELRVADWIGVQAELLYSRQGVTDKYTKEGIKIKDRLKSHYLNVPVLANFYVTENLALKTGVQAGFCLGARSIEKHCQSCCHLLHELLLSNIVFSENSLKEFRTYLYVSSLTDKKISRLILEFLSSNNLISVNFNEADSFIKAGCLVLLDS